MNSPTMVSMPAISGGRPATVTPNTTSSRPVSRPSRIAQAAWMMLLRVSPWARVCRVSATVNSSLSANEICSGKAGCPAGVARRHEGRSFETGEHLPPRRFCAGAVLRGDPGEVVAIGCRPRQRGDRAAVRIAGLAVEREQLAHQHRQRPAVHQDVMAGEDETMLVRREADQRQAEQRRRGEVEARGALGRCDLVQPRASVRRPRAAW